MTPAQKVHRMLQEMQDMDTLEKMPTSTLEELAELLHTFERLVGQELRRRRRVA